jgi:hypothetical protein
MSTDFYASEFPNRKRPSQRNITEQNESPKEPIEQPTVNNKSIDNLPPVPQDYEVPTEIANAAPVDTEISQQQVDIEQSQQQPIKEVEPDHKASFRELREAKQRAERERDELLKIMQQQYQQQSVKQEPAKEEDDFDINPDDLVEGKHLKKYVAEVKKLKKELHQQHQQYQVTDQRSKLRNDFNDFDKVVNEESLAMLQSKFPAVYNTLNASSGSLYDTGASAYTMIKQLGVYKEDTFEEDRKRVAMNAAKPKPLASLSPQKGDSPLSNANAFAQGFTPDLAKQMWKETQEAMGNKSSATNWYIKK